MPHLYVALMLEYMFQYDRRLDEEDYDRDEWSKRSAPWIDGFLFGTLGPLY